MPAPPRLAVWIVRRFTPEPTRPYLLADLDDRFQASATRSILRARLWYWRQAVAVVVSPLPGTLGVLRGGSLAELAADLRHGARSARRQPLRTVTAVLTLGLGIGVVGTAFSILWGTVLRGLPFDEADRLVHFERSNREAGLESMAVTPHDFVAWRDAQRSFEDLGAFVEAVALFPNEGSGPDRYLGVAISPNSFPLLRVEAAIGRTFTEDEAAPGGAPVVLLSHRVWESRFGGDRAIVGREVVMNGRPTTVVGVMPEGFGFPIAEQFWAPLRLDFSTIERGSGRLDVFGRLAPDADLAAAIDEFGVITSRLAAAYPGTNTGIAAELRSFTEEYVGPDFVQSVYRLLFSALLVLLVCCANVANFQLIRGVQRRRALAVRAALGATRARLIRQLATEAFVLSAIGAGVGTALAAYGVAWFNRAGTQSGVLALPHGSESLFWWDVRLDGVVIAAVVGVTAITTLVAGIVPARHITRSVGGLRGGRSDAAAGGSGRFSAGLTTAQLALACGLLVAAGLVGRSVWNAGAAGALVDGEGVVVTTVPLPASATGVDEGAYPDHESRLRLAESLLTRLQQSPGVVAAAVATELPLDPPGTVPVRIDGDPATSAGTFEVGVVTVSPGYFDVFGTGPIEGRTFDDGDRAGGAPVVVANRSFVDRFLGGRAPIGARVRVGDEDDAQPWATLVGVVPDLWDRPNDRARQAGLYFPVAQSGDGDPNVRLGRFGLRYPTVAVRAAADGAAAVDLIRSAVYTVDPALPIPDVTTMAETVDRRLGRYRVWARFYLTFAAAALLLAALGVYGVLSFEIALRRPEIGVRRALGASAADVQREVLHSTAIRVALGLALGLALGVVVSSGIAHVLYGVDTRDPRVFAAVAALLSAVAALASWLPARRAAGIDPLVAIRGE